MNVFCPTDVIFAEKAIEPSHDKANKYIMYSDKKNILQLVALLIEHNIKKIVLCPGSRNSPIVHTIANHPFFSCYPVTDERSAAFFAIGLALHGGSPAAVCCTSGSALLNIHPAVSEAFYQQVPLVVISADQRSSARTEPSWERTGAYQRTNLGTVVPLHYGGITQGTRHHPLPRIKCLRP